MKKYLAVWVCLGMGVGISPLYASLLKLDALDVKGVELHIYPQNLALVSDTREADLAKGKNVIAFEGVSEQMKPETAFLVGEGIQVLEQNYAYDLLNKNNLLQHFVGKEVKTVIFNPDSGENYFDKATVVSAGYGNPLLKFSYGIESDFPGRIVFNDLPENLKIKPTFSVSVDAASAGAKNLVLNYLTTGLSWQTNYVAELVGKDKLNWQAWATLTNNSGTDYKNAKISLVSGQVNNVQNAVPVAPMARGALLNASFAADRAVMAKNISAESMAEYYQYSVPFQTDLINQQSKQILLMEAKDVAYETKYQLKSPLMISFNSYQNDFEALHPEVFYHFKNDKESHLGVPLPEGVVRFYDAREAKNLAFVGSDQMEQTTTGKEIELSIGKVFDVYAKGKIVRVQKLSDKSFEADVAVQFFNQKEEKITLDFEQAFNGSSEIVTENIGGKNKTAQTRIWTIDIPAKGEQTLTFTVKVVRN